MSDAPEATIETVTVVNLCLDDALRDELADVVSEWLAADATTTDAAEAIFDLLRRNSLCPGQDGVVMGAAAAEPASYKIPRWSVTAHYALGDSKAARHFVVEELFELHEKIEGGPDFTSIEKIEIRYALGGDSRAEIA